MSPSGEVPIPIQVLSLPTMTYIFQRREIPVMSRRIVDLNRTVVFALFLSFGILLADEYKAAISPASDEAAQAIGRIQKPEGFRIELVAAEPLLANPVAFCLDEQGRFYIAETFRLHDGVTDNRNNMKWLKDDLAAQTVEDRINLHKKWLGDKISTYTAHPDRVRQVVDTDGDGKADKSTVFSDSFNKIEDGIGAGLLAKNGDVYFTCIPDLWLLRDADGDGIAEQKKSLQTGYGVRVSFLGHDLHGLIFGPDGKLYFSIGDRGLNVPTPSGRIKVIETGAVLRCNPDGTDLEVVHTGLRNPQELAFDEFGNLFTGDNNSDSGDKARLVNIVEGGDTGWRMPYQYIESPIARGPWNEEKLWHPRHDGQPAYIIPPIQNFADGPSGLVYNPGVGFPPSMDRSFFLADFRGGVANSGVRRFRLEADGAGFKVVESDQFLWNVLATDVDFGYDGCFYVLDWVEGWAKPGKGRIYRVYHPEYRAAGAETATILARGIENLDVPALCELLKNRDMRIRQRAQFALAARPAESKDVLTKLAVNTGEPLLARIHSIWALGQIGRKDPSALTSITPLLADPDAEIRAQVARTIGDVRFKDGFAALIPHLQDESPRVQFLTAIALGRIGNKDAAGPLLSLIEKNGDKDAYIRHAGVFALASIHDEAAINEAMKVGRSPAVRLAALLVLRRWESPLLAEYLKQGEGFSVSLADEAARAIYDVPVVEALPALAALASNRELSTSVRRRAILANVRLGETSNAKMLADIAADGRDNVDVRKAALKALENWGNAAELDPVIGIYRPIAAHSIEDARKEFANVAPALLASPDKDLRLSTIDLAGHFKTNEIEDQLVEIFRNKKEQAKVRAEALRGLGEIKVHDLPALVQDALDDERQTVRTEARKILATLDPKAAVEILSKGLEEGNIEEKQRSLETLSKINSEAADAVIAAWLDRMVEGKVPPEIRLDIRLAAAERKSAEVKKRLAAIDAKRNEIKDPVAKYEDALVGGNADRGGNIFFEKTAAACLRCHKIEGRGGEVGPDLTKAAEKNDRKAFLEAIADPNRKIAQGFDSVILLLNDGRVVTGVLREETEKEVTVIDADNKRITVAKDEIDERQRGKSAMPEDAITKISESELRDLIEYLTTRK